MASILTVLQNNPNMMAKAIGLRDVFNDAGNSVAKRMLAAVQLADLMGVASIEAAILDLGGAVMQPEKKPKRKLVRGAWVTVKE
jgi:hypothetical protein